MSHLGTDLVAHCYDDVFMQLETSGIIVSLIDTLKDINTILSMQASVKKLSPYASQLYD